MLSHFVNIGKTLASEIVNNIPDNTDYTQYLNTPRLETCKFKCVTQEDIMRAIDNLENKNSSGHDGISNRILKYIKYEIRKSLTLIINQMMTTGIFPDAFKKSKITPIFKKGESSLLINYRPISLLPTISRIRGQSNDKATGMDGLSGESLKFADPILAVLLSICFTCMFKHCYFPSSMLDSVIVPLVTNRNGDLSDKNNYRPIALSSTISKVFENVILYRLEEYLWTADNQFGFKAGHSTDLCVYALTEFIEYFKRRSNSVYVAFLDASKAFNKINHWVLF